jgi:hypothetical protein
MRKAGLAALVAILVVAGFGIDCMSGTSTRATETFTSVSTSTATSITTFTSTETSIFTSGVLIPISSASSLNPLTGLSLDLNLSTDTNGQVVVTAYELNTLDRVNNVSSGNSSGWPNFALFQWTSDPFCDAAGAMDGFEILRGDYGPNNYTSGEALWLQPQHAGDCNVAVVMPSGVTPENNSYVFQPSSVRNAISETYVGSWTPSYTPFAPGTYTVVAGDQWGQVAVLHFVVAG